MDYDQTKAYLKEMAYPFLSLSDERLNTIFHSIDYDKSGTIDKTEMKLFVHKLMQEQKDLQFKEGKDSTKHL